jgi:outer membrane immunogenic protein
VLRRWNGAAAQPTVAPVNWNGLYVDAGAGVGVWTGDTTTIVPGAGVCSLCAEQWQGGLGALGTIGVGFDHQVASQLVLGAFADGEITGLRGTLQDGGPYYEGTENMSGATAVGARLGWLARNDTMLYAELAWAHGWFDRTSMRTSFTGAGTTNSTPAFERDGFMVGGGIETAVAPNWFLRAEYRYSDYGTVTLPDTGGSLENSIRFHPMVTTMRATLAYKWGFMGAAGPAVSAWTPATWTGFYLAAGGGFGQWSADTTTVNPTTGACRLCATQTQGGRGGFGTLAGGYDWEVNPRWVIGAFVDGEFADLSGSIQDQDPVWVATRRETSAWALGARGGYLFAPGTLGYVNGGYSEANFEGGPMITAYTSTSPTGFFTHSTTQSGFFVGFGGETALASHWFLRGEYRFAQYDKADVRDTQAAGSPDNTITFRPTVQTGRVAIVYKFQ